MEEEIPKGFKGIIYEPSNEQELIALFLLLMHKLKLTKTWCIQEMKKGFPDAIFLDTYTKKETRVEFEYLASHFINYGHDEKGCDWIICWNNDLESKAHDMGLKIFSLKDAIKGKSMKYIYLGFKKAPSLSKLTQDGVKNKKREFIAVKKIIIEEIPKLIKKYKALFLDEDTSAHYVLRWNRKGFLGIYPDGRLVAEHDVEYVKKFGESAREAGKKFRNVIKEGVKGFSPKLSDKELDKKISTLKKAIEEFCQTLIKGDEK